MGVRTVLLCLALAACGGGGADDDTVGDPVLVFAPDGDTEVLDAHLVRSPGGDLDLLVYLQTVIAAAQSTLEQWRDYRSTDGGATWTSATLAEHTIIQGTGDAPWHLDMVGALGGDGRLHMIDGTIYRVRTADTWSAGAATDLTAHDLAVDADHRAHLFGMGRSAQGPIHELEDDTGWLQSMRNDDVSFPTRLVLRDSETWVMGPSPTESFVARRLLGDGTWGPVIPLPLGDRLIDRNGWRALTEGDTVHLLIGGTDASGSTVHHAVFDGDQFSDPTPVLACATDCLAEAVAIVRDADDIMLVVKSTEAGGVGFQGPVTLQWRLLSGELSPPFADGLRFDGDTVVVAGNWPILGLIDDQDGALHYLKVRATDP